MPDQERYDRTIEAIDGALHGDTSADAMRWTPEPPRDDTWPANSRFRGGLIPPLHATGRFQFDGLGIPPRDLREALREELRDVEHRGRDWWRRLEAEIATLLDLNPDVVESGSIVLHWTRPPDPTWSPHVMITWREIDPEPVMHGVTISTHRRILTRPETADLQATMRALSTRGQEHHA